MEEKVPEGLRERLKARHAEYAPVYQGRAARIWKRFKSTNYSNLRAMREDFWEDFISCKKRIKRLDEELEELSINTIEVSVPVTPRSAQRIDVPVALLMNDAFERMDEEFPYEKGSLAYQWEWVKRKLRVEMNLSEASFHCQVLGEIMRQKRYSDRVDDSPPLHLEEIFIFRPSSHNPLPKNVHKARAIRLGRRLRDLDSKYDIFTENGEYVFVKLTEWASQKEECGSSAVEKSLKHPDVDLWPHGKSGEKAGRRLLRLMKDLIDFADQHDGKED